MKTLIIRMVSLLAFGVLGGSLLASERIQLSIPSVTADAEYVFGTAADPAISVGDSRQKVLAKIGEPPVKLNGDNWAYINVTIDNPARKMPVYDTLVIVFSRDRVSDMYLTKRPVLDGYIVDARRHPTTFHMPNRMIAHDE